MPCTATKSPNALRRPFVTMAGWLEGSIMSVEWYLSGVFSRFMTRVFQARIYLSAAIAATIACTSAPLAPDMNQIAERYVKLVLLVGQHDDNFVDAYYGDPSWKPT